MHRTPPPRLSSSSQDLTQPSVPQSYDVHPCLGADGGNYCPPQNSSQGQAMHVAQEQQMVSHTQGSKAGAGKGRFVVPVPGVGACVPGLLIGKTCVLTGIFPEVTSCVLFVQSFLALSISPP